MGNVENVALLLALLVIVAAIVWIGDKHLKAELERYTWVQLPGVDPAGNTIILTARVGALVTVLALDKLDLSPQTLEADPEHACVHCRAHLPHTRAACVAAFDTYGRPEPGAWYEVSRSLRAFLLAAQVSPA